MRALFVVAFLLTMPFCFRLFEGNMGTGSAIWDGTLILCELFSQGVVALEGATVLELGTGLGAGSTVASAVHAHKVVASDGDEELLELTERNMQANLGSNHSIVLKHLVWGNRSHIEEALALGPYDYIFGGSL